MSATTAQRNGRAPAARQTEILDTAPAHSIEIEQAALACMFLEAAMLPAMELTAEDFYCPAHRMIYAALAEVFGENCSTDFNFVVERLKARPEGDGSAFDYIGGAIGLAKIASATPNAAMATYYATRLRELSTQRRLRYASERLLQLSAERIGPQELVAKLTAEVAKVTEPLASVSQADRLKVVAASELGDGEPVDWLWRGWLAKGSITLLVGLWKAGKTTLLSHVLRSSAGGGDIAGDIAPCKVLVVSEESEAIWAERRDKLLIADNVKFICRPFTAKPSYAAWEQFCLDLAELVKLHGFDAVVLDPWQSLNPALDENDSAGTMRACLPLQAMTKAGAAVLLTHHPRKGDGTEGQASRGSGALTGFVDTIVEFRRFNPQADGDCRRVLRGLSRFAETPSEAVIELAAGAYRTVGSKAEATRTDRLAAIELMLPVGGDGLTAEEMYKQWGEGESIARPSVRTLRTDLKAGADAGRWERTGSGTRTSPHRFRVWDSGNP